MRHVSEGFAVSFTACVPVVLKFTLQIADVLYCIFKPTLERLSQLHFISQLYFVSKWYKNGTVTRTIVGFLQFDMFISGEYIFCFIQLVEATKSRHDPRIGDSEKLLQSPYFSRRLPTPLPSPR